MSTIRLVNASDIFSKNKDIAFKYSDNNICPICSYASNELKRNLHFSLPLKFSRNNFFAV